MANQEKRDQRTGNSKEKEICKPLVDRIANRRTFEPFDRPTVGCRFVRFRMRGESVEGMLGFPIPNFQQSTSYPLQLDSGEVVEIVGNRLLHKLIREGELCGRRVRIQYVGRDFIARGHHRKIYRAFEVDFPGRRLSAADWDLIITQSKKRGKKCQKDTARTAGPN